jgi:hypothetical protein
VPSAIKTTSVEAALLNIALAPLDVGGRGR